MIDSANLCIFVCAVLTISFNQSTYQTEENSGVVQPVLVLINPSSTNITVQVIDKAVSAAGEQTTSCSTTF